MTFEELQTELYEDLNGRIVAIRLTEDAFHFDFECDYWREKRPVSASIACLGVVESTVSVGHIDGIAQDDGHAILWDACEPHDSIFFSSPASNPFELLGRLYDVHHRMFEGYRLPSLYFQTNAEILGAVSGELASAPRSAIAAYHEVAKSLLRCSIVRGPERSCDLHAIFFDEAYVICREFTFTDTSKFA